MYLKSHQPHVENMTQFDTMPISTGTLMSHGIKKFGKKLQKLLLTTLAQLNCQLWHG